MSLITIDDDSSDNTMVIDSTADDSNEDDVVEIIEELSNDKSDTRVVALDLDEPYEPAIVETVEIDGEVQEKPILELMKHLINYNGKQNKPLTNTQLIGILKNEFHIDVNVIHHITVDIYINVLKKFLKDWPQWDEFDRLMHESRCMNDNAEIERMLEAEYKSLKDYLAGMLKVCKPFARVAAQKVKRTLELPSSVRTDAQDVILEINCTRDQLNKLFFRRPHPDFNDTIFNVETSVPSRINLKTLTFKSILNSSYINISINTNCFKYKRESVHTFKRTLVNKKLKQLLEPIQLNPHLQITKTTTKPSYTITKKEVNNIIDKIRRSNKYIYEHQKDVETIFKIVNEDFDVIRDQFTVPSTFRYYMNPYPYVRYLYKDVETESEKYDLQLEEILSPRLKFSMSGICFRSSAVNDEIGWLKLECTFCKLRFIGVLGIEQLKNHFRDVHQTEPDWMCMNCELMFTASELASKRWYHKCSLPEIYNSD